MIDIKLEEVGFTIQNFQKVKNWKSQKFKKSKFKKVKIFKNPKLKKKIQSYNFLISNDYQNRKKIQKTKFSKKENSKEKLKKRYLKKR